MLSIGSRGSDVRNLQKKLHLHADGVFGAGTKKAVQHFQKAHHMKADGVVGNQTGQAIFHSHNKDLWDGVSGSHGVSGHPSTSLNTVAGCARFLLHSKNVRFWSGLSTGSDRKNVERLARGERAFVPATGRFVTPKLKLMQALVAMAKRGPIQINALTGGHHSPNSNHYHGTAVDLDLNTRDTNMIVRTANQHGGRRNFERDHIHLDF